MFHGVIPYRRGIHRLFPAGSWRLLLGWKRTIQDAKASLGAFRQRSARDNVTARQNLFYFSL
jgi:hypothetical protein